MMQQVHIHTSRTSGNWWSSKTPAEMRDEIRREHGHMAYNAIIAPCGTIMFDYDARNAGGPLHVCLVPVRTIIKTMRFADYYTRAQRIALRDYLYRLERHLGMGNLAIGNHDDVSPGFRVVSTEWL